MTRHTHATVRLDAIVQNLESARSYAPDANIIAVIKANAYGHGAIEVAHALQDRVPAFAVAFMDEAVELRDAGITRPILVLQGTNKVADVAEAAANDFWLMLHSRQQVERVLQSDTTSAVKVWVKADTGMHRLGLGLADLGSVLKDLSASKNVQKDIVLCTHLASADELQNPMTRRQVNLIREVATNHRLPLSIANSAAIMAWPEAHAEWNRPGIMLYGSNPLAQSTLAAADLVPAMTMSSEIISIQQLATGDGVGYGLTWVADKPSTIGTVAIGYGDGYPRHAPNGTPVLVNGQRVPLVGTVSMDMLTVDLSQLEDVETGDPVELWGQNLSVNEVASHAGTIGYELLAGLTGRVPITYLP